MGKPSLRFKVEFGNATGRLARMGLQEAFMLFRRLGVDVLSLSPREFAVAYCDLAKRYHPDTSSRNSHDLMANINAARAVILQMNHRGSAAPRLRERTYG